MPYPDEIIRFLHIIPFVVIEGILMNLVPSLKRSDLSYLGRNALSRVQRIRQANRWIFHERSELLENLNSSSSMRVGISSLHRPSIPDLIVRLSAIENAVSSNVEFRLQSSYLILHIQKYQHVPLTQAAGEMAARG